jgi:hypothetical protein
MLLVEFLRRMTMDRGPWRRETVESRDRSPPFLCWTHPQTHREHNGARIWLHATMMVIRSSYQKSAVLTCHHLSAFVFGDWLAFTKDSPPLIVGLYGSSRVPSAYCGQPLGLRLQFLHALSVQRSYQCSSITPLDNTAPHIREGAPRGKHHDGTGCYSGALDSDELSMLTQTRHHLI